LRERADFANYKRRMERDLKDAKDKAGLDTISKVLPVVDDFERALQNIPADLRDNPWVSGTALIQKKFDKLLDEYGVQIIDPVGQPFDPHQHEAIGTDTSTDDIPSGHVTATLQKGYISGERVLRPALVRVAG
jgi:molecular chaperone GrpE